MGSVPIFIFEEIESLKKENLFREPHVLSSSSGPEIEISGK